MTSLGFHEPIICHTPASNPWNIAVDASARVELSRAMRALSADQAAALKLSLVSEWRELALALNERIVTCNKATDAGGVFKLDGVTNDDAAYDALCYDVEAAGLKLNGVGWVVAALCGSRADWDYDESAIVWEDSVDEDTQCWETLDVEGTVASLLALA